MTQQVINVGSLPGDGTGDKGQVPFTKVNANFTELYGILATPASYSAFPNSDPTTTSTNLNAMFLALGNGGRIGFPIGPFTVNQLTLLGSGVEAQFDNTIFSGISVIAQSCVVEIKCGQSHIRQLHTTCNRSSNYTCGAHWYTNDLTTVFAWGAGYYPGYNRIDGLKTESALIGLVIGALPLQTLPLPAANTIQAGGIAIDAPLSESYILGLSTYDCIQGCWVRQSNGKLTFVAPELSGTLWGGYATPADCCALVVDSSSELTVLGGSIEQIASTTLGAALIRAKGGTLSVIGSTLESVVPVTIEGAAIVRMKNLQNWGLTNDNTNFFQVLDSAVGELHVMDTFLARTAGYATAQSVLKTVSSFGTGSFSVNWGFWANFTDVEFRDANWAQGATYNPLVAGCRARFRNCWLTTYSGSTRTAQYKLDDGPNILVGQCDISGKATAVYPQTAGSTSQGWTGAVTSASDKWGSDTSTLPTIPSITGQAAFHLLSVAGESANMASPKVPVQPQKVYRFAGGLKVASAVGGSARVVVQVQCWDYSGAASSTATIDLVNVVDTSFVQNQWRPESFWFQTPKDCDKVSLVIKVTNGAEAYFFEPEVL